MERVTLQLTDLACPSCAQKIGEVLGKQKGIARAEVLFTTSKVKVEYDPAAISVEDMEKVIARLGYRVVRRQA